jgi:hypothetical protein
LGAAVLLFLFHGHNWRGQSPHPNRGSPHEPHPRC